MHMRHPWIGLLLATDLISGQPNATYERTEGVGDRGLDGSNIFPWTNLKLVSKPILSLSANDTGYHTNEQILTAITNLRDNCGGRMAIENSGFMQVTLQASTPGPKKALFNFGIHGRELISSEIALSFLQYVCDGANAGHVDQILAQTTIKVVPLLNPHGRNLGFDQSGSCTNQRKNENKVDLNRNFDVQWTTGSNEAGAEDFRGSSVCSEAQCQFLTSLGSSWQPHLFIDIHSGDKSMLHPYSYTTSPMQDAGELARHTNLLKHVKANAFGGDIMAGAGGTTGAHPYTASGTTKDWFSMQAWKPLAFTFETYGKPPKGHSRFQGVADAVVLIKDSGAATASTLDPGAPLDASMALLEKGDECFTYFNPPTREGLQAETTQWTNALLLCAEWIGSN